MKVKELSMTELVAYNKANDMLLQYYENKLVMNIPNYSIGSSFASYDNELLKECENKRLKCNAVKELIINEMNRRINELC